MMRTEKKTDKNTTTSNRKIKDFYKYLILKNNNGKEYKHAIFDYQKIWEDKDVLFYLIISERGLKGKSTGAKWLAKHIWDNYKSKSMWVMNTRILIQKEKKSHLAKPKQIFKEFENVKIEGDFLKDDKDWFMKFTSLSTAENEKGSRDDYELLIFDEFNVGDSQIKKKKLDLLSSLIATLTDDVNPNAKSIKKIIMHGNNKSMNDEFLIRMGIYSINNDITDIKNSDGKIIGRIFAPITNQQERITMNKRMKDNNAYQFQKLIGREEHVYFNSSLYDELNNIKPDYKDLTVYEHYYLRIQDYYFRIRKQHGSSKWKHYITYVESITNKKIKILKDTENIIIYCMSKRSLKEDIILNPNLKINLINELVHNNLWFENSYSREVILDELRR